MNPTTLRSKPAILRAAFAIALVLALAACGPEGVTGAEPDLSAMAGGAFDEFATYADADGTITAPLVVENVAPLAGAPDGVATFIATTQEGHTLGGIIFLPGTGYDASYTSEVGSESGLVTGQKAGEVPVNYFHGRFEDSKGSEEVYVYGSFTGESSSQLAHAPVVMVEPGTQLTGPEAGTRVAFGGPVTVDHILPDTKDPFMEQVLIGFHSDTARVAFTGGLFSESKRIAFSDASGLGLLEHEGIFYFYATPFGPVALGDLLLEIPDDGPLASRGFMVASPIH